MKILVTGGAGFIGSNTVKVLKGMGYRVSILDDFSTGKTENIKGYDYNISLYRGDICCRDFVDNCIIGESPDIIIHLASRISVAKSNEDPAGDALANVIGAVNILEASRRCGVKKVIYSSTAAVYGNPAYLPIDELHPVRPLSAYGLSKHTAERYLSMYRELYGLDYTVLRYANVYGFGQDATGEGGVVSVFLDRLIRGEQPNIHGDGEQTRDFIHVSDIVQANLCALKKGSGATINIGTGRKVSIKGLYEILKNEIGYGGYPRYASVRPGDIRNSWYDISRAGSELGWAPRMDLRKGIRELVYQYKTSGFGDG